MRPEGEPARPSAALPAPDRRPRTPLESVMGPCQAPGRPSAAEVVGPRPESLYLQGFCPHSGRRTAISWTSRGPSPPRSWTKPLCEPIRTFILKSCPRGPILTAEPIRGAISGEAPGNWTDDRKVVGTGPGGEPTSASNRDCRCASRRTAGPSGHFCAWRPSVPGARPHVLPPRRVGRSARLRARAAVQADRRRSRDPVDGRAPHRPGASPTAASRTAHERCPAISRLCRPRLPG